MTLTIVASAFLLFRATDRRLMLTLAVLVPIYVLAFYTGNFALRAISGTALLLAIGWLLVWVWGQYLAGERSLQRLAVTLGLTSFAYGAVIGVLMQVGLALEISIVPVWLGLMLGLEQAAGGIYLLTQLVAVVLFVVRIVPPEPAVPARRACVDRPCRVLGRQPGAGGLRHRPHHRYRRGQAHRGTGDGGDPAGRAGDLRVACLVLGAGHRGARGGLRRGTSTAWLRYG